LKESGKAAASLADEERDRPVGEFRRGCVESEVRIPCADEIDLKSGATVARSSSDNMCAWLAHTS
jgi:hypothetical protein